MLAMRKRPDDRLDYDVEYERWLSDGDTVQSADAEIEDAGTVTPLAIDSVQVFGSLVKVWLSGGVDGVSYSVKVTATSTEGRVKEIEFIVRVREC